MGCDLSRERALAARGIFRTAGVDEAGRGPLAGPVMAAAVILPLDFRCRGLTDSKRLAPPARERYFDILTQDARIVWAVAEATVEEIDRLNILRATHLAMRRAVGALSHPPDHLLVDGLPVRDAPRPHTALVDGDALSLSIAAASVIAKVVRDRHMLAMDGEFPQYGFARHKGYAVPEHLTALHHHGPCRIHRQSFAPVAQRLLPL